MKHSRKSGHILFASQVRMPHMCRDDTLGPISHVKMPALPGWLSDPERWAARCPSKACSDPSNSQAVLSLCKQTKPSLRGIEATCIGEKIARAARAREAAPRGLQHTISFLSVTPADGIGTDGSDVSHLVAGAGAYDDIIWLEVSTRVAGMPIPWKPSIGRGWNSGLACRSIELSSTRDPLSCDVSIGLYTCPPQSATDAQPLTSPTTTCNQARRWSSARGAAWWGE
jgi:hypothetical protein